MRQTARLLTELRKVDGKADVALEEFMTPSHFDDVVQATRNIAATAGSTNSDNSPSLALKLGYNISQCAGVLWGKALRNMDEEKVRKVEYFQKLYSTDWKLKVSSQALTTMRRTDRNREEQLPICEDLLTFREYLLRKIKEEEANLKLNPSAQAWTTLAELILARIISFNKRRAGEVSKMLLDDYNRRLSATQSADITSRLTPLERQLCQR